jgi:hypothetical protein
MNYLTQHKQLAISNQELAARNGELFPSSYFLVTTIDQREIV